MCLQFTGFVVWHATCLGRRLMRSRGSFRSSSPWRLVATTRPPRAASEPPAGQAWLTEKQLRGSQDRGRAPPTSRTSTTRSSRAAASRSTTRCVAHVFSPVNGRVTRIDAALGQRVKKGDALAVIDSPDMGIASSDVGKAQADLTRRRARLQPPEGAATRPRGLAARLRDSRRTTSARRRPSSIARARRRASSARAAPALVTQGFALTRAHRRRGHRAQRVAGHRGAGALRRRHAGRALHRRRARPRLGHGRRLRDGPGAREGGLAGAREGRRVPGQGLRGQGRLGRRHARPADAHRARCAAPSRTPTACSSPRCTRP